MLCYLEPLYMLCYLEPLYMLCYLEPLYMLLGASVHAICSLCTCYLEPLLRLFGVSLYCGLSRSSLYTVRRLLQPLHSCLQPLHRLIAASTQTTWSLPAQCDSGHTFGYHRSAEAPAHSVT